MRKLKNCSDSHNRLLRGLALGCCYTLFGLVIAFSSGLCAQAAEIPAIESETVISADMEGESVESVDDTNSVMDGSATVSGGDAGGQILPSDEVDDTTTYVGCTCAETLISFLEVEAASEEEIPVYETLEEFLASPANVDRYQYEILKRLEFMQYSQMILIGLIFVLIFKKK